MRDPTSWAVMHSGKTGTEFETDMVDMLSDVFQNSRVYKIRKTTGTIADTKEGTDFFCGEIRLDATMDFRDKDFMPFVADTGIPATEIQNFLVGVRHGNSHRGYQGFPEPVVVIGVNMDPSTYHQYENLVMDNAKRHATELMDFASDCLEDYITTDPTERKDLYRTVLRPNPRYREPRNIEPQYARSNRVRRLPNLPTSGSTNPAYDTDYYPQ